jgi:hypothetical protein
LAEVEGVLWTCRGCQERFEKNSLGKFETCPLCEGDCELPNVYREALVKLEEHLRPGHDSVWNRYFCYACDRSMYEILSNHHEECPWIVAKMALEPEVFE